MGRHTALPAMLDQIVGDTADRVGRAVDQVDMAVAGRLDRTLGGPPIDPHRAKEDDQKRLVSGPIDGRGRRSLYIKMTLMEPPRFLALFNQPMPKVTVGKRDRTTVPDQALALLNDPFVTAMAKAWAERVVGGEATSESGRIRTMLEEALGRPARPEEVTRLATLASASAEARGVAGAERPTSVPLWQDVAHAIFLTQEFSHVE